MGIVRSSFLVGPDGRIAKTWPKVRAEGHAERGAGGAVAARGDATA